MQCSDCMHNLFTATISCSDGHTHATVGFRCGFCCAQGSERRCRQRLESANRAHADSPAMEPTVACKRLELLLHCGKNAADLLGGALVVLGGKNPESDRRNFEVNTPLEQFVQLVGACHVRVVWMQPIYAAKPTIAIQNQSYMPGHRKRLDLPHQAMLIDPINWSEHPATAPACKLPHVKVPLSNLSKIGADAG